MNAHASHRHIVAGLSSLGFGLAEWAACVKGRSLRAGRPGWLAAPRRALGPAALALVAAALALAPSVAAAQDCLDLREFEFEQSPWGRPNTVLYAQSVVACGDVLSEVSMRARHDGGPDVLFAVLVTGTRPGGGGLGQEPDLADIRWRSPRQTIRRGQCEEIVVSPNLAVEEGDLLWIVFDAFSYPASGWGVVLATMFNGSDDLYPPGEFVYVNDTGEQELEDFNARNWGHRGPFNEDLALRVRFGPTKNCRYRAKRVLARGGCESCPARGDVLCSDASCGALPECPKSRSFTIPCPDGPGTCRITGKRQSCASCEPKRCETYEDCDDGDPCTSEDCAEFRFACALECWNHPYDCGEGYGCREGDCFPRCDVNEDCQDENMCTSDTCVDHLCENVPVVECPDQICNPETGDCVDCLSDENCNEGERCVDNTCIPFCIEDVDCDDANSCTVDICLDGICVNEEVVCEDDGDLCTTEACDPQSGCASTPVDCNEGEVCDPNTGECVPIPTCRGDPDCDDGLFCNGRETCVDGACTDGPYPCRENEECDEFNGCEPGPPDFNFTLDVDDLGGTEADEVFAAPLEYDPRFRRDMPTLQTGDRADGGDGEDVLVAQLIDLQTPAPTLVNIESLQVESGSLDASNITGLRRVTDIGGGLQVVGLQQVVDFGFSECCEGDIVAIFRPQATIGNADETTITGGYASRVNLVTGANGFEAVRIVAENYVDVNELIQTNGRTLRTLTCEGDRAYLGRIPDTVAVIDASAMSGDFELGYPRSAFNASDLERLSCGEGNDTLEFGPTLTGNDHNIDGGEGYDAVSAQFEASPGAPLSLRNVEALWFEARANDVVVNLTGVAGLNTISVIGDGCSEVNTLSLLNIAEFPELQFHHHPRSWCSGRHPEYEYDAFTYGAAGANGGNDRVAVTVHNFGQWIGPNGYRVGALTINLIEHLELDVYDGPAIIAGIQDNTLTTLTATAHTDLDLGTVGGGNNTILSVDAVNVLGKLSATFNAMGNGGVVNLGDADDTVSLAGSGGANALVNGAWGDDRLTGSAQGDILSGDEGDDELIGEGGPDNLTGGDGADTFSYRDTIAHVSGDSIADFEGVTGDTIVLTGSVFLHGRSVSAYTPGTTIAALTIGSHMDKLVRLSNAQTSAQIATGTAQAVDAVVLVFDSTKGHAVVAYDQNWSDSANRVILNLLGVSQAEMNAYPGGEIVVNP